MSEVVWPSLITRGLSVAKLSSLVVRSKSRATSSFSVYVSVTQQLCELHSHNRHFISNFC